MAVAQRRKKEKKWFWDDWISMCKNKLRPLLYTKSNTVYPRPNYKSENDKTCGRKCRRNLCALGLGREFLDMTPKAWAIKENIDKLNFIILKKTLIFKRCHYKSETISHRLRENI